jgi:hypothetical protein
VSFTSGAAASCFSVALGVLGVGGVVWQAGGVDATALDSAIAGMGAGGF